MPIIFISPQSTTDHSRPAVTMQEDLRSNSLRAIYLSRWVITTYVRAAVAGYSFGTLYLAATLDSFDVGITSIFDDVNTLVFHVLPVITNVVGALKVTVNQTIDLAVTSVDFTDLAAKVFPPMTQMADGLDFTQQNMQVLLLQGDKITADVVVLITLSKLLTTTLTNISNIVVDLSTTNKSLLAYPGNAWILGTAIGFSLTPDQIEQSSVQAPNVSLILNPIRTSPNLSTFAEKIRDVQVSSLSQATEKINSAGAGICA
jgi:hypothetical protein